MKSKIFRIYVDGKLRLITGNKLVAMNNFENFTREYGLGRVEIKEREFNELSKVELQDLKENIKRVANNSNMNILRIKNKERAR